jgi:hypothetical protein
VVWVLIFQRKKMDMEVVGGMPVYPEIDGKGVYRSELPEMGSK